MSAPEPSKAQTSVSLRSVSLVTFFSVGQLIVLFLLHVLLAKIFGASQELDVYMAVLAVPLLVSAVLSGSLGSVIIPLSHELKETQGTEVMESFLSRLGWVLLAGSTGLTVLVVVAAAAIMRILFGNFPDPQIQLGSELLRIVGWLIPLSTMTSYLYSVFHAQGRFLQPAASGLIGPLATVALVLVLPHPGIHELAWAVLLGGVVGVVMLLPGFPRFKRKADFSFRDVYRRFGVLIAPLILGTAFMKLDPIVDRHLLAGREGSISHLGYAWRLISAIALLASSGLSVVVFPAIARHSAAGDEDKFVSELAHAWRFLCVMLVPMIGGILCYSQPLVAWLLERGEFTPADTYTVASLMCFYVGAIVAAGMGGVATHAYYSLGNTWTPTWIGIVSFGVGALLKFWLVPTFEVKGVALITSAYFLLYLSLLLAGLRLQLKDSPWAGFGRTLARSILCTVLALGSVWLLFAEARGWRVLAGICASIACYVGLQFLFRDEFAVRIVRGLFSSKQD